ncbi:MAG: LysR family transcriptional regulator, partial [Polaromonas sp.]
MTRRLPPLKALRVVEAAACHASFTAAAEALRMTHSAVSQQIRRLEDYGARPALRLHPQGAPAHH